MNLSVQLGSALGATVYLTLTPGNIADYTGRSLWAVERQLEAIDRRADRGQRVEKQLARLIKPRRGTGRFGGRVVFW